MTLETNKLSWVAYNKFKETTVYNRLNDKRLNNKPNIQVGWVKSKPVSTVVVPLSEMDVLFLLARAFGIVS